MELKDNLTEFVEETTESVDTIIMFQVLEMEYMEREIKSVEKEILLLTDDMELFYLINKVNIQ